MGINWNNVIKNQAKGMDPMSAYYKEEQRMRKERREQNEKLRNEHKQKSNHGHNDKDDGRDDI